MDQEGANYFTTDSTFSVPIILNSDGLDTFGNPTMQTDPEPLKDDSNEVPRVLQNDISEEENINGTENIDIPMAETPTIESEPVPNQMQNLKACISME